MELMDSVEFYTEDEDVMITLELDDGTEMECVVLFRFPLLNRQYVALLPADQLDNVEADVLIYRFSEDEDGEVILDNIEDDDEFETVAEHYDKILDQMELEDMLEDGPEE